MKLILGFLFFISCNTITTTAFNPLTDIAAANNEFSTKLYGAIAKKEKGNILFSPISIHMILSLLKKGAAGTTAEIIKRALYLNEPTEVGTELAYEQLIERLNSIQDITLKIVNKIYVQKDHILKKLFNFEARMFFFTETENLDFTKTSAAKTINDWVENKTDKKITDLISPDDLNLNTRLVLVNAIYFKGDWLYKFNATKTTKGKFYLSETVTVDCDMMHMKQEFLYGEDEDLDAQILNAPYKNEKLSLTSILPRSKTGIEDLERKLQTKSLSAIIRSLRINDIILSVPKGKVESTMELNGPLSEIGLADIFSDNANFSNLLIPSEQLKVDKIIQKVFLDINEEGTEASTATGAMTAARFLGPPDELITFQADHAFVYILSYSYNRTFIPLFVGRALPH